MRRDRTPVWGPLGVLVLVMPFTTIANGLLLSKMWEWFVADTFGVQELTVAESIGLSLVTSFMTYQWVTSPTDDLEGWDLVAKALGATLGRPLFVFAAALVIVQFTS